MSKRGIFITFEGIDSCGKSVQLELLAQKIVNHGITVTIMREPGGTEISEKIRTILLDQSPESMSPLTELLLFSAARAQLLQNKISPLLESGHIILCDRFYDSTTAYQGYGRGIDISFILHLNDFVSQKIAPDTTYLFDITVSEMNNRIKQNNLKIDRMESQSLEFFEKVRQGYLTIANNNPDRFVVLNGHKSIEDIEDDIWNHFQGKYLHGGVNDQKK